VHLQYWTAFVDGEGRLNFRRDLYARDDAVIAALEAPPPGE
jgi:murein L,D-transpeptidase YcbB/YkuD